MLTLLLLLIGDRWAGPQGHAANPGTRDLPWDLATAISKPAEPGTTVWVLDGEYEGKFEVRLRGTKESPCVIRPAPGARATILDSALRVNEAVEYVWIRDLEIRGSTAVEKRVSAQKGSWPGDLQGSVGLEIFGGKGCKFINLVIHDNTLGGVNWWIGSTDSELYGCLIYNNGWKAPDRDHGHSIYVQNKTGVKTIAGCVLSVPAWGGSHTMHAYGSSRAWIDRFVIEDNISFGRGSFLVGGGRPSREIRVARNYLHGAGLQVGYDEPDNEDCEVRDNVSPGGLRIGKFKKAVDEGNVRQMPAAKVVVIPNAYDAARAHVAVYNGAKAAAVEVELPGWTSVRLMDPLDVFGRPVLEGKIEGGKVRVPMSSEFAAFVALKGD